MAGLLKLCDWDRLVVWLRCRGGCSLSVVAGEFGVSTKTVSRVRHDRRMEEMAFAGGGGCRLSLRDREEISRGLAEGVSGARIAGRVGVARSTVNREISRNGGREAYRACAAHERALRCARRPKPTVFELSPRLAAAVEEGLVQQWSPEEISGRLRSMNPDDPQMHVSHESIYRALLVHARGGLRKELAKYLRSGRQTRKSHGQARRDRQSASSWIPEHIQITHRPKEIEERLVPGDWEGDLIMGHNNGSQIATCVDRTTGIVLLTKPESRHATETTRVLAELFNQAEFPINTLTWDRGVELADHRNLTKQTKVTIYFADPYAPWQRGSSENVNGLLRQYFPKGRDLTNVTTEELNFVMDRLNNRPRKRYGFLTPLEQHQKLLGAITP